MNRIISVIIPVKNGAKTIGALLDRLLTLSPPVGWTVEIVVGYQDSDDGTAAILKDRNVCVAHCAGTGPSANRNAAVARSRGELLYFIDADACPVGNDFLQKLIHSAQRLDALGGLGGPILIDPAQRNHPIALADHYACWFCWHPHRDSGESFFQPSAHLLVPRSVFESSGGFDEDLRVLEDFDLQCRIKQLGLRVYFDRSIAITHHARPTLSASWRHSWYWGAPAREGFYCRIPSRYPLVDHPRLFWINFPWLFFKRTVAVSSEALTHSWWRTLICFPFLLATVAAWTLAATFGSAGSRRSSGHSMTFHHRQSA